MISVRTVIAKVMADLNIQEDDLRISDILEWCGEAMEHIGAIAQYEPKVVTLPIINHQVPLPCDLHQLHQVAYSFEPDGPWFPTRKATGSFAVWGNSDGCYHDCREDCCGECRHESCCEHCDPNMIVQDDVMTRLVVDMYGNIDNTKAIEMLNTNQNLRTIVSHLINHYTIGDYKHFKFDTANPSGGVQYTVKPGFIMCNAHCGYLKLSYSAIKTDENGYPLIPDMISFSEAIYWYITMKLKYPEYLNGRMNREIYYDIKRSWNFYAKQAYAEAMMPNEDGLESLKNNWNKLVPEYNDHNTFYSHTGERQTIYNANNTWL